MTDTTQNLSLQILKYIRETKKPVISVSSIRLGIPGYSDNAYSYAIKNLREVGLITKIDGANYIMAEKQHNIYTQQTFTKYQNTTKDGVYFYIVGPHNFVIDYSLVCIPTPIDSQVKEIVAEAEDYITQFEYLDKTLTTFHDKSTKKIYVVLKNGIDYESYYEATQGDKTDLMRMGYNINEMKLESMNMPYNTFICGASGSGTTVFLKHILDQSLRKDKRVHYISKGINYVEYNKNPHVTVVNVESIKEAEQEFNALTQVIDSYIEEAKVFMYENGISDLQNYTSFKFKTLNVLIDEIGMLFANDEMKDKYISKLAHYMRIGRSYGITFYISSQSITYMPMQILQLCEYSYYGKIYDVNSLKIILTKEIREFIKKLPVGGVFVNGKYGNIIKIPYLPLEETNVMYGTK